MGNALSYREGWLRQAIKSLEEYGYIKAMYFMAADEDLGMRVQLTGSGIEYAEELCNERGSDLYEEIEEQNVLSKTIAGPVELQVPASDRVVKINHNAPEYQKIVAGIETVTAAAKKNNSLKSAYPEDFEQRIAELEAGKRLIDAPQANAQLVYSSLTKALKWILEKIVDNVVAATITPLLLLIAAYFGFG
jgi:hypothetical protein